jgi:hypothetical protein
MVVLTSGFLFREVVERLSMCIFHGKRDGTITRGRLQSRPKLFVQQVWNHNSVTCGRVGLELGEVWQSANGDRECDVSLII